jgi:UPF0176 protein
MAKVKIIALYQFTPIRDVKNLQEKIVTFCKNKEVFGSLLIAPEGINGTIAGDPNSLDMVVCLIETLEGFNDLNCKISYSDKVPFRKLRVRLKKEIISMGVPNVDPLEYVGNYIEPDEWNEFSRNADVVLIDTRNDYEVAIGTFKGAINPKTEKFRDFPDWWSRNAKRFKDKKVAMFCTGGIRCEKSTNFLMKQDFTNVYHLKGGILKYLEVIDQEESIWEGECFVFDQRVSVKSGLEEGSYSLCFACRRPISCEDKSALEYEEGVSCHQCINEHTAKRKDGFRERQRQSIISEQKSR